MIELRMIDGETFAVTRNGKKEFVRTVADQVGIEERGIADCEASIADGQMAARQAQQAIEQALLNGESAVKHRAYLAASNEMIDGFTNDANEARQAIRQIHNLIDTAAAAAIRQKDDARLAELITPYEQTLKEFA